MRERAPGYISTDVLGYYLRADGDPDVVHSILGADFFCVVERGGGVAVGEDEDGGCREDFECVLKRCWEKAGGFVAGDQKGRCR